MYERDVAKGGRVGGGGGEKPTPMLKKSNRQNKRGQTA